VTGAGPVDLVLLRAWCTMVEHDWEEPVLGRILRRLGAMGRLIRLDRRGTAVHIAARVAGAAGPSEILTTGTVRDLVAGSGLAFDDRGIHELKGIPEPCRLWAVRP